MSDDKLKRAKPAKPSRSEVCGVCETTSFPCPGCTQRVAQTGDVHGWRKLRVSDPELATVMLANARAARHLATLPAGHSALPEWEAEYQRQGEALYALYERRHASR